MTCHHSGHQVYYDRSSKYLHIIAITVHLLFIFTLILLSLVLLFLRFLRLHISKTIGKCQVDSTSTAPVLLIDPLSYWSLQA